jgi:zinc-finger of transposase IS204/IS1001/IS1096/IS1165/Helix-turn-helix domain of transposase family ISL3
LQDTKLFETILGIQTPWRLSRVALDTTGQRVDLWAEHEDTRWPCPNCRQELPCRDHAEERVWRHLDTCQYQTFLHARVPRVDCPTHGVRQVRVSWAEARSRFTLLMERLIIDLIQQCSTVIGACRIARITWDEAWGVMSRAVARGRARKVAQPIPTLAWTRRPFGRGIAITRSCAISRGRPWSLSRKIAGPRAWQRTTRSSPMNNATRAGGRPSDRALCAASSTHFSRPSRADRSAARRRLQTRIGLEKTTSSTKCSRIASTSRRFQDSAHCRAYSTASVRFMHLTNCDVVSVRIPE